MTIYTAVTNYGDGLFGSYTSLPRARKAIEFFFNEATDIVSFEDTGNYSYSYTTENGGTYSVTILIDTLDWEYITGEIEEDSNSNDHL